MAAGLSLGGGIVSGIGQYESGKTRSELYGTNAEIADAQARSELQAGAYNTEQERLKNARTTGAQISAIGGNNLTQGGTSAQVVASTARTGELNALQVENNAARRAWGFQVQGESDRYQGQLAERGGILGAAGAIAGAGGRYAMQSQNPNGEPYYPGYYPSPWNS